MFLNLVSFGLYTHECSLYFLFMDINRKSDSIRVGKKYFIQTPNKYFPIEPHYLFPFFQFMSYNFKNIYVENKICFGNIT